MMEFDQMNRSIFGNEAFRETRDQGLAVQVAPGKSPPAGWRIPKVPDSLWRILAPRSQKVTEYFDKGQMDALEDFAGKLGIPVRTETGGDPRIAGSSDPQGVMRRFGTPEEVLAHEIGHQLTDRFGLDQMLTDPTVRGELQRLADLRASGRESPEYRDYLRQPHEMMANLVAAYLHAPDLLKEVAPTARAQFETMIDHTPGLEGLRHIKPSLELGRREQAMRISGGLLTGFAMPDAVAKLYENHLAEGLGGNTAYKYFRGFGNAMTQFKLGWSAFHGTATALNLQFSAIAEGLGMASRGDWKQALAKVPEMLPIIGTGVSLAKAVKTGRALRAEWNAPGSQAPEIQQLREMLEQAGGRGRGGVEELGSQIESLKDTLARSRRSVRPGAAGPVALARLRAADRQQADHGTPGPLGQAQRLHRRRLLRDE